MKKSFVTLLSALMLVAAACGTSTSNGGETSGNGSTAAPAAPTNDSGDKQEAVTIGITQIVEHPSLDAAREGFLAALKDAGYTEGENLTIDYQNAQGDMNTNVTIAQKFASDKVDLVLAIATPSAQAMAKASSEIPIVFTAVTDPLGAKLVDSLEKPGGNVTGVSDTHPDAIQKTMESVKEFFPEAKNVGIIYNNGEQNSVVNVENAKEAMGPLGLQPVEVTVANSSEVKQAADSLVGRVDVIYIPKDNTVVSALDAVVMVANDKDIPLFVGETDSVKAGGFAGFGFEYRDLGYTTGQMAIEILKGKNPSDIPVGFPAKLELMMNTKTAKEQNITITDEMKSKAILYPEE
ncbi:ABC transporter substrate-binding protein [Brevibacillus humidisoli]|uniref:ABC transporter substrate-binding protein n=1 Tax=Brevibacillus humidisoli TaxID=2895522 RepID=UPI001E3029C3|nr:ABC transporter substrate-binding protein [Brevibacillus humidisoli]UFJ38936.1 ABC transporter substrate-binding protein [Brevibacillus humidisoli]